MLLAFAGGASQASAASAATLPAEGIFAGCDLDTQMAACVQRLAVIHQGGFQVVVSGTASPAGMAFYAAAAHQLGMSVMWEISDPAWWQSPVTSTSADGAFSGVASACGCSENGALLAYLIHFLGSLPGTYGYYAADDSMLSSGDQAGVAAFVTRIKQQDPVHTVMIGAADEQQSQTYQRIADVIGTEIYPVTDSSLMPVSANLDMWDAVGQTATDAQNQARRANRDSAFILQAFTWGDNPADGQAIGVCSPSDSKWACYYKLHYPSAAEQLELRNEVIEHAHPKLILWWSFQGTYGSLGGDDYSIYPTGSVAATRWAGLTAAIRAPAPGAGHTARPAIAVAASRPRAGHAHRRVRKAGRPASRRRRSAPTRPSRRRRSGHRRASRTGRHRSRSRHVARRRRR